MTKKVLKVEFGLINGDNVEQVLLILCRRFCVLRNAISNILGSLLDIMYSSLLFGSSHEQLRKVNTACFPVSYNEKFYQDVVERNDVGLNKYAYWNGFVVGAVCTRVEPLDTVFNGNNMDQGNDLTNNSNVQVTTATNSNCNNGSGSNGKGRYRLYIMTLGVLAAYRDRGIGTQLIQSVLDHVAEHNQQSPQQTVEQVALHVQISNQDAIRFYTTRFGFVQGEMVENYYRRIDPPHCYLLYKNL